jgi:hypothetical protein
VNLWTPQRLCDTISQELAFTFLADKIPQNLSALRTIVGLWRVNNSSGETRFKGSKSYGERGMRRNGVVTNEKS